MEVLERLALEFPLVQAGMGGGLSSAELAGVVSAAGALGTIGLASSPQEMCDQLRRARAFAPGRPVAANLLMPFTSTAHVQACIDGGAACVVLFCGFSRSVVQRLRSAGVFVLHQVGTLAQAARALADGADGLIAQGIEAGGHLLGVEPAQDFLIRALERTEGRPVLLAGGIAQAADVRAALDAGAAGAVAGTRFLLTEECCAHPLYKQRVLSAQSTTETLLFSMAWYDRHRVVPNAATDRWCRRDELGPRSVRLLNRLSAPMLRSLPTAAAIRTMRAQRLALPLYGPAAMLAGMDERLAEVTPLYAGQSALRIERVLPAARAVRELCAA